MKYETIIIGGGPAGSAAAIHLARHGVPVRLLERQSGAHHKVCGEFISYEAAHHLNNLGLDLPALGAVPIRHARFYNGEQEIIFDLPFTAWSLSRRTLDSALLKQAESAGAKVEPGTAVKQLLRAGNGWELTTSNRFTSGNSGATLSAQTIFLASGKHELRDWPRNAKKNWKQNAQQGAKKNVTNKVWSASHDFIGLKMHFIPNSLQQTRWQETVEIHLFNGGYAGLEPIENGGVNLCFLIKQDIYKTCGGRWPAVLDWLGYTSSHMKHRLANLTPLWHEPLAIAGVPYGYIASACDSVPNLFRVGDQAAVIPSFVGDGIAIALHTASLAACVHIAGGDSKTYQQQACKDLTQPVRNAKLFSDLLSHRVGRKAAFTFALLSPKSLREKLLQEMIWRTRVGLVRGFVKTSV
jgi:flavin-dependent dehydrogenase